MPSVIGGASFIDAPGGLTVSRPLAILCIDHAGLSIDFRTRVMRRFQNAASLMIAGRAWPQGPGWTCAWDGLNDVRLARRSVILTNANGDRCRFQTGTHAAMRPLENALSMHGIVVHLVRSTLPDLVVKLP